MPKRCESCGIVKKITFHCSDCGKVVCLACYNFVYTLCKDCETKADNVYYNRQLQC